MTIAPSAGAYGGWGFRDGDNNADSIRAIEKRVDHADGCARGIDSVYITRVFAFVGDGDRGDNRDNLARKRY